LSYLEYKNTLPSAYDEDWNREKPRHFWDPSRKLLKSIRKHQYWQEKTSAWALLNRNLCVLRHHLWSVITGVEIHLNAKIGGGLLIPHPNGIVIHPSVEIGPNCLIFQQVTCGALSSGVPKIGGHVDIGAGAKVLGDIVIGNDARIGANAVVLASVKEGTTVVGILGKSLIKEDA